MKKLVTLCVVCFLTVQMGFSQACTINNSNNTPGLTPTSMPCITQGQPYGQTAQVMVPSQTTSGGFTVTIDSVYLRNITGLPAGITVTGNPLSRTIPGGGRGCLWFAGTSSAPVGTYPIEFQITAWVDYFGFKTSFDTTLSSFGYNFQMSVCSGSTPAPTTNFSGTPLTGCGNLTVTFTDNSTGSPTSRLWTFVGGTPPTSTASNPTVTYSTPGNYNVKLRTTNAGGSDSLTKTNYVHVYAKPSVTVSSTPASSSGASDGTATANVTGGTPSYTYAWSGGGTANPKTGLAPGNYTVTVTDANNCSASGSVSVSFNNPGAAPVANFSASTAAGCGSVNPTFTDNSTNTPTSWAWTFTGGNPPTSTLQNPSVTYNAAGSYNVKLKVTNANGSDSMTKSSFITVYPVPNVNATSTPATTSTTANGTAAANATGGTAPLQYLWSNNATTATVSGLLPGQYIVTVTDANNCERKDTVVVSFGTGIAQLTKEKQVKVFPDPATDFLNLQWSSEPNADISIVDLNGKLVKQLTVRSVSSIVDIKDLAIGLYIMNISDRVTHEVQSLKFRKQ